MPIVNVTTRDRVAWVELHRPEAMNSLTFEMIDEVRDAFEALRTDREVRCVVLTGSGRAFCSGSDLSVVSDVDAALELVTVIGRLTEAIEEFPKPVIAAVNGIAVAGGLEIAMACDFIVASDDARLGDAHSNYGMLPGGGATARLQRCVGLSTAKLLMFTGKMISAAEAHAMGLVALILPSSEFHGSCHALAKSIGTKSPLGLRHMKGLLQGAGRNTIAESLAAEREAIATYAHSADFAEGLNAFEQKRKPQFQDH